MKTMAAGAFKAKCLAVMDDVQSRNEAILITKRGKPVVKLVPVHDEPNNLFGFLKGKVEIKSDLVKPVLSRKEWGSLG